MHNDKQQQNFTLIELLACPAELPVKARRRSSRSFTLIELLVVISIISILMTLLLPSLKKAKDISRKTVCASNQKQVGVIFQMYIGDHDGYWPRATWNGGDVSMSKWWYKLWSCGYVKEWDTISVQHHYASNSKLCCSVKREIGGSYSYAMPTGGSGRGAIGGYYWNGSSAWPEYTRSSQIKNPSRKVAMFESFVDHIYFDQSQVDNYVNPIAAGFPEREQYASACHLNGSNFLYADIHVNWQKKGYLTWSTAREFFEAKY